MRKAAVQARAELHVTPRLSEVLTRAEQQMMTLRDEYLSVEHLVLAMVEEGGVFRNWG